MGWWNDWDDLKSAAAPVVQTAKTMYGLGKLGSGGAGWFDPGTAYGTLQRVNRATGGGGGGGGVAAAPPAPGEPNEEWQKRFDEALSRAPARRGRVTEQDILGSPYYKSLMSEGQQRLHRTGQREASALGRSGAMHSGARAAMGQFQRGQEKDLLLRAHAQASGEVRADRAQEQAEWAGYYDRLAKEAGMVEGWRDARFKQELERWYYEQTLDQSEARRLADEFLGLLSLGGGAVATGLEVAG